VQSRASRTVPTSRKRGEKWGTRRRLRHEIEIPMGLSAWNPTLRKEREEWGTLISALQAFDQALAAQSAEGIETIPTSRKRGEKWGTRLAAPTRTQKPGGVGVRGIPPFAKNAKGWGTLIPSPQAFDSCASRIFMASSFAA
jgi:hypothetical protein